MWPRWKGFEWGGNLNYISEDEIEWVRIIEYNQSSDYDTKAGNYSDVSTDNHILINLIPPPYSPLRTPGIRVEIQI